MSNRNLLDKPTAPVLPAPGDEVTTQWARAFSYVLRLFFTRVSTALVQLLGLNGGRFLQCPNAVFYSTADQPLVSTGTAQLVTFNQTYLDNGFTVASSSRVTATYGGVYCFNLSAQLTNANGSAQTTYIWLSRDGTDIGMTTREYTIEGSGKAAVMKWSFIIDMNAGSYLEVKWAGTSTDLQLEYAAATSPHPGVPSVALSVHLVSALPETLPSPP